MSASVGTSEYLSPEVLMDAGSMCAGKVNQSDDWWSFGALAYEMLSGQLPFSDGDGDDDATIFFNILNFTAFAFPKDTPLSEDAKTFITSLLSSVESRASFDSIKRHAFFAQVDWSKLWDSKPEFVPDLSGPDDSKYVYYCMHRC